MINEEEIGKRIKDIRVKNNLTQATFAESLSISRQVISKVENGNGGVSLDLLDEIVSKYNVSLDYLIYGKEFYYIKLDKRTLKILLICFFLMLVEISFGMFFLYANLNPLVFYKRSSWTWWFIDFSTLGQILFNCLFYLDILLIIFLVYLVIKEVFYEKK